jgi:hypothetical protein
MPQLDKLTYSTQIFWLLTFFILFYFIILKNVLASILLNIKTRITLIEDMVSGNTNTSLEIKNVTNSFVNLNTKALHNISNFLQNSSNVVMKYNKYLPLFIINKLKDTHLNLNEINSTKKLSLFK